MSSLARVAMPSASQQYSPESLMVVFLITNRAKFFSTLISYLGLGRMKWPFFSQRMVASGLVISQLSSASSPGTALTFNRSLKMCTGFSKGRKCTFICIPTFTNACSMYLCGMKQDVFQLKLLRKQRCMLWCPTGKVPGPTSIFIYLGKCVIICSYQRSSVTSLSKTQSVTGHQEQGTPTNLHKLNKFEVNLFKII